MEGYQQFTSSLQVPALAPAGNSSSLLVQQLQPTNLISQQYYYEYQQQPQQHQQPNCTDYLFAPPAPLSQNSPSIYYTDSNTQVIFNTDFTTTNSFTTAVSTNNTYQQPQTVGFQPVETTTIVPESFDFESLLEDSSVFFSPQASSAESSASQSPESQSQFFAAAPAAAADSLDLSLDELLQNIGNSEENNIFGSSTGSVEDDLALSDELLEVLKDVEAGEDFFSELNFGDEDLLSPSGNISSPSSTDLLNSSFSSSSSSNSSVSSTPKRKYSSDSSSSSSTYCSSEASYQTAFNSSSSEPELEKATATKSTNKRARRAPKASPGEKAARKKDQNKRAACRYRSKKRTELQSSEMTMEELEDVRDSLAEQVKKLQTEFSVILPLAKAAFTFDPAKRGALAAMLARVGDILA